MRPDGTETELPMGVARARGRRLSPADRRRVRDLLGVLLVRGAGLSRGDAAAVLQVNPDHLMERVNACPVAVRDIFARLSQMQGGAGRAV